MPEGNRKKIAARMQMQLGRADSESSGDRAQKGFWLDFSQVIYVAHAHANLLRVSLQITRALHAERNATPAVTRMRTHICQC